MTSGTATVIIGNQIATDLVDVSSNPACLDTEGWWAVIKTFEGDFQAFRFANVEPVVSTKIDFGKHVAIPASSWTSSFSQAEYQHAVESVREAIADGWVYQTNLCLTMSSVLTEEFNPLALWKLLAEHHDAPYLSAFHIPARESGLGADVKIASASPELFLRRRGKELLTSPIKGTATDVDSLLDKDATENVMIVDLMRNDLSTICDPGSVSVPEILRLERHPGLVHLVSDVEGQLRAGVTWPEILIGMTPAGSVSGAPKSSALEVIRRLESVGREIYCGVLGWVNADDRSAELAVGIRTFWQGRTDGQDCLKFGTGAGITWGSTPSGEWEETQLKAARLMAVAAMSRA